jgi:hypothetical protein
MATKVDVPKKEAEKADRRSAVQKLDALAPDIQKELDDGIKEPVRAHLANVLGEISAIHSAEDTARRLVRPEGE